jgi:hypothetical protein
MAGLILVDLSGLYLALRVPWREQMITKKNKNNSDYTGSPIQSSPHLFGPFFLSSLIFLRFLIFPIAVCRDGIHIERVKGIFKLVSAAYLFSPGNTSLFGLEGIKKRKNERKKAWKFRILLIRWALDQNYTRAVFFFSSRKLEFYRDPPW